MSGALKFGKFSGALKFGKFKNVPLADVPADYIEFLLSKPDLYPRTKAMLTDELARRRAAFPGPNDPESDAHDPDPDEDVVPPALRDTETEHVATRCPHCGRRITVMISLEARR